MPFRNIEAMPWEERLLRFHELSEAAFQQAAKTDAQKQREEFLALGTSWYMLAKEAEQFLRETRR
jgi:hypothetical protein